MPEHGPGPTPEDAKIGEHPISSFNLNAHGENPDWLPEGDDGPDLTPSPQLQAELVDRHTVEDPATRQQFGFVELNRGADLSATPLVSLLAYSIDTQDRATSYELEQIALQSGRRVIAYENPSTGLTDKLTKEQREALKEGDFSPIAKGMLGAMKTQGLTKINLEGTSMGARLAMSVAANAHEFGITVDRMIVIEPPGLIGLSVPDLMKRFLVTEGMANMPAYIKLAQDERGKETLSSSLDVVKDFITLLRTDARGNAVAYPKGLAQETGLGDLVKALEAQPELEVNLVSGGASAISPREAVNAVYHELSESYPGRVGMVRLPGDTHAVGTGAARRMGWHVSRILAST